MGPIEKRLPPSQGVNAGGRSIFNVTLGESYRRIDIRYVWDNAGTPTDADAAKFTADIKGVKVIVDGDVKWNVDGAYLLAMQDFYKEPFVDGVLPIYFTRPWLRTILGEDAFAYGTKDMQTFTIEIDIDGSATPETLDLYAEVGPNEVLGDHVCIYRHSKNNSITGISEISDIPRGPYQAFAIHFATGNIDSVDVEANGKGVFEADVPIAKSRYGSRRNWQTGYYHLDFANQNRKGDALPLMLQDFRVKANFTGTGAYDLFVERIEGHNPMKNQAA